MSDDVNMSLLFQRVRFENPWWIDGHIEKTFDDMPRRGYFNLFRSVVDREDVRRAVVLMGPRRIGKTVMLHHYVDALIKDGVNPRKIIFITVENPIYNGIMLEQLFQYAKEASGISDSSGWHVIFDEIQYIKGWEIGLKVLIDSYFEDRFIVSGSAAAALKYASNESGAGRFTDFLLPPLTFSEFLKFSNREQIMVSDNTASIPMLDHYYSSPHIDELNRLFVDYINFVGYPELLFSGVGSDTGRYIRSDIIEKVLLRDLPGLYGISDTRELNAIFTTIAWNSGNEFSLEGISKESQVSKETIRRYLEYLQAAYLIKKLRRIDQGGKRFKRDNFFKLYLTNPALRAAIFTPLTAIDDHMGSMTETAIFSQSMDKPAYHPWYARWRNGEVDMVNLSRINLKPETAVEIKWSNRFYESPGELKSLYSFCKVNNIQNPVVTTIDKTGVKEHKGFRIQYVPAAAYAYSYGLQAMQDAG